jgi:hypothetical protein
MTLVHGYLTLLGHSCKSVAMEVVKGDERERTHEEALRHVKEALQRVDYGSVLITIHQGEVVGIETATKVRLRKS